MTAVIDEASVEVSFGVEVTLGHQKGCDQSDRTMVLENLDHHLLNHFLNQWDLGGKLTLNVTKAELNGHITNYFLSGQIGTCIMNISFQFTKFWN